MTDETPLTTTAASTAVREAFEAHYADLVEELTPVGGNEAIATQAVDEAFRRAAALSDFAEYGRPREWLAVMARNHIVRKPFRREDLEDSSWERSFGGFERPTLAASLERARASRRKELVRTAGLGAAAVAVGVALAVAVPQLVPTASPTSPPAAAPSSSSRSSPPLIPSPTTSTKAEVWPPTVDGVTGHPSSTIAYTVISSDTPSHKATVWRRCRYQESYDGHSCEMPENRLLAVEVVDGKGHRVTQLLGEEVVVRPATKGAFAIVPLWGGSSFQLISPTTDPKPFTTAAPVKPKAGQMFRQCDAGPCIVDLQGVVTPVDLPKDGSTMPDWNSDTTDGWLGWTTGGNASTTVYIQQPDGSFGSVDMTLQLPSESMPVFFSGHHVSDGAVIIAAGSEAGFGQLAVSTDRGRTWQVRWSAASPFEPAIGWRSLPVVRNPALTIGRLQPVR